MEIMATGKRKKMSNGEVRRLVFYSVLMVWPVMHFLVFFVYLNINAFLMPFQNYDITSQTYFFTGTTNFSRVFSELSSNPVFTRGILNGLIIWGVSIITLPIPLLMSYYIFAKKKGHGFFKVLLFMPTVISMLVMNLTFKFFTDEGLPRIVYSLFNIKMSGLIYNYKTALPTIIIWHTIYAFGSGMLINLGMMNNVSDSVIESAKIDGASYMRIFLFIVVPLIYPLFVISFTGIFLGIFTADIGLFSYYGEDAPAQFQTLGYYIFIQTRKATVIANGEASYGYIAAIGIMITAITLPLTLLFRRFLIKLDPQKN